MIDTYQAALDWLYSFIDSEKNLPQTPAEFNLPRTSALLELVGNPQDKYPAIVIAGTKGKGSTCAMIESILRTAGLKTGFWSSPHLHSYRERLQVNRELPEQATIIELVNTVQPALERLDPALGKPSTYEIGVVLGLLYFSWCNIDLAVLEIGLGGRFDAINSVTPLVSVITAISYDHMAILGNTLSEIAGEKAGIIKPHIPIITCVQPAEAANVIAQQAKRQNAPLFIAAVAGLHEAQSGMQLEYPLTIRSKNIGLAGEFQLENARLASSVGLLLREMGLPISDDSIRQGIKDVTWPARFETIAQQPSVIVDGAHNGASARVLLQSIKTLPHKRLILILGTSADKDIESIARELVPSVDIIILTQSRHPRALPSDALRSRIAAHNTAETHEYPDVPSAIKHALAKAEKDDLICITGSLFIAAEAREAYGLGQAD